MRSSNTLLGVVLCSLIVSGAAFAQLSEMDRTSVFRGDVVQFGMSVTLCHIPPGSSENARTIEVVPQAVAPHLAHGDLLGECPYECNDVAFPATGQTSCWDGGGSLIDCTGTGQDGDVRAGAALSYTDNGDGTVTDNNTGLMWEKKGRAIDPHYWNAFSSWEAALSLIDYYNTEEFAGYDDWRMPNVKELQSIINYEHTNPAVSAEFNANCVMDCPVLDCSCTISGFYWSSTFHAFLAPVGRVWAVNFLHGDVVFLHKDDDVGYVRAVRGGLFGEP